MESRFQLFREPPIPLAARRISVLQIGHMMNQHRHILRGKNFPRCLFARLLGTPLILFWYTA